MSVRMIRSKVQAESVTEVDAAVERMFAAIERAKPDGIRYASCRLSDGVTYVALLEIQDGVTNPLPALPEFTQFQESLQNWLAEPPIPEQMTVIAWYGLF